MTSDHAIRCGRVAVALAVISAIVMGFVASDVKASLVAGDPAGIVTSAVLCGWTAGTWGATVGYVATMLHSLKLPPSHPDAVLRQETSRDFINAAILAVCLAVIYAIANKDYDPQGIDIASLGLPFLISSLLLWVSIYRSARAKGYRRPYVALLLLGLFTAILVGMMVWLGIFVRAQVSTVNSVWLQMTIVATSIVLFMITVYVDIGLKHELASVKSAYFVAICKGV